jgi:uncharacterized protein (DUF1330 family)
MVRHTVLFQFAPGATRDERAHFDRALAALAALARSSGARRVTIEHDLELRAGHERSADRMLVLDFHDGKRTLEYFESPEHVAFLSEHGPACRTILAIQHTPDHDEVLA